MRRKLGIFLVLAAGCGDCEDQSPTNEPDLAWNDVSEDSSNAADLDLDRNDLDWSDLEDNDATIDMEQDTESNMESDAGNDLQHMTPQHVCGDGIVEVSEACDDGNTEADDYCSPDCGTVTGMCGDGLLQGNETCDDGQTTLCATTHDGGDGRCIAVGTCSPGYALQNGVCTATNTTGLTEQCQNGSGYALMRFSFSNNSTSASIDVWDASCSYSFANQACNVTLVYPGFGSVSRTSEGFPILTSTQYLRARFSVAGLSFTQAKLYVRARSYSTGSSTQIRAWSPLYGDVLGGPVDNDFTYDWYTLDWSQHLFPSDNPNLTAFQIYAYQGSTSLAVRAVELCLE